MHLRGWQIRGRELLPGPVRLSAPPVLIEQGSPYHPLHTDSLYIHLFIHLQDLVWWGRVSIRA